MCGATRDVRFVPIADIADDFFEMKKATNLGAPARLNLALSGASECCGLSLGNTTHCFLELLVPLAAPAFPAPFMTPPFFAVAGEWT